MKTKAFLIALAAGILAISVSCSTLSGASDDGSKARLVTDSDEQIDIIYKHFPDMYVYYAEGVMKVKSIIETVDEAGEKSYDLNYVFQPRKIRNESEILFILRDRFPKIYNDVRKGTAKVKQITATAGENGRILYDVELRYLND